MSYWGDTLLGDAKQASHPERSEGTLFAACVVQGVVIASYRRFFALTQNDVLCSEWRVQVWYVCHNGGHRPPLHL